MAEIPKIIQLSVESLALSAFFCWVASVWFRVTLPQDFRRANFRQVSTFGGLCIFVALFSVQWINGIQLSPSIFFPSLLLLIGGLHDDRFEWRARNKLALQLVAVTLFLVLRPPADHLVLVSLGLSPTLSSILTGFWILGMISALNMIDGSDLEAAIICLGVLAGAYFLGISGFQVVTLMCAVFGFMLFNRPPAKIFLGENGSSFLGFWLASQLSVAHAPNFAASQLFCALTLLGIAEVDAVSAILRRLSHGVPLGRGDRGHVHHRLQNLGVKGWSLALYFVFCQSLIVFSAYAIAQARSTMEIATPLISILAFGALQFYGLYLVGNLQRRWIREIFRANIGNRKSSSLKPVHIGMHTSIITIGPLMNALAGHNFVECHKFSTEINEILDQSRLHVSWALSGTELIVVGDDLNTEKLNQDFEQILTDNKLYIQETLAGHKIWPLVVSFEKSGLSGVPSPLVRLRNEEAS